MSERKGLDDSCLSRERIEDGPEALAAVLVEEKSEDEERDCETRSHRGLFESEHAQSDDLGQHQREHRRIMHNRPHLPRRLVLRAIHVQNLHNTKKKKINIQRKYT